MTDDKARVLERTSKHLSPAKVALFHAMGIDIVIGKREGYRIWDIDGRELLDLHLNGGTYNSGHRHPEVADALRAAPRRGARHREPPLRPGRPRRPRGAVARSRRSTTRASSSRAEAARRWTSRSRASAAPRSPADPQRRGAPTTGTSLGSRFAAGHEKYSRLFHSDGDPADFTRVPFDSLPALGEELARGDVAA
ncbi:MAG: hypothetical protein R3B82_23770 [Sandaracinaceae bacterium]